jgi:hypothetical protein
METIGPYYIIPEDSQLGRLAEAAKELDARALACALAYIEGYAARGEAQGGAARARRSGGRPAGEEAGS